MQQNLGAGLILQSENASSSILIGQAILEEQPGENSRPGRMREREVQRVRDPFVFAPLRQRNQEDEKKKIKQSGEEEPSALEETPISRFIIKTSRSETPGLMAVCINGGRRSNGRPVFTCAAWTPPR